ncbi:MAG: hypothetical protein WC595_06850 [Candidatus Nanoarchaeia archaeon]
MVEKLIQTGEWDLVDFREYDSLRTNNLDACVAAITYSSETRTNSSRTRSGSLAHHLIISPLDEYFAWIRRTVNPDDTNVYLVGGKDRLPSQHSPPLFSPTAKDSFRLVHRLELFFTAHGYYIANKHTFGMRTRNVTLFAEGRVEVEIKDYSLPSNPSIEL